MKKCSKCKKLKNKSKFSKCSRNKDGLHCHHLTGVELNPIESADIDNCATLYKEHHKEQGCRYKDLKRNQC